MTTTFVHPTACVEVGALIGEGTKVWHFSHVMSGAKIGARSILGKGVFVAKGVEIGAGTKIQNHVSIYCGVKVEEEVFLGPHVVFTNVKNPRAHIPRNAPQFFHQTRVGRRATIGANATIAQGVEIGAYAFVAAGALVAKDVPPFAMVMGNPAKQRGWACCCGERLDEGRPILCCASCGASYQLSESGALHPLDLDRSSEEEQARPIPLAAPARDMAPIRDALCEAFERVLDSGQFILGETCRRFEESAAESLGCAHAIGVSSGSDALVLALRALEVGPGDEVITTPMTFVATAEAILRVGAKPVFVDITRDSLNLDPDRVEGAITPRTAAILAVHLFGNPAHLASLHELASARGIPLVEDIAQAFGARTGGRQVGSFGQISATSFFPTKNLGALGDGGMVFTSDAALAERVRLLRLHGLQARADGDRVAVEMGYNARLDALQAALLQVKLPHLEGWNQDRRRLAAVYDQALSSLPGVRVIRPALGDEHSYQIYTLCVPAALRDALKSALTSQGIAARIYYDTPLHRTPFYREFHVGTLPEAERACAEALSLPLFPSMRDDEQARVIQAFKESLESVS